MAESDGHYVMIAADGANERVTLRCICGWVHLLGVRPTPHDALMGSIKHHMHPERSDG